MKMCLAVLGIIVFLFGCGKKHNVEITRGVEWEGQECFKIVTSHATYYYQIQAGGFASIFDSDYKDWVSYRDIKDVGYPAGAASEYRGIPNSVYSGEDNGTGHPGFINCTSEIIAPNKIVSESLNKKWKWEWIFFDDYAQQNFLRVDTSRTFWFLYEGTPGGTYDPENYYWGNDVDGLLQTKPDHHLGPINYGSWQWVYFGTANSNRVMFFVQKDKDEHGDQYALLGNTQDGVNSPDGMTVMGFGRYNIEPLMKKKETFYIGFYEKKISDAAGHSNIEEHINKIISNR